MPSNTGGNMKIHVFESIRETIKEFPEYTFGQIIYSIINSKYHKGKSLGFLLEISDSELYNLVEKARENERE